MVTMDKESPTPILGPGSGAQNKKLTQKQCQLAIETCQCWKKKKEKEVAN